MIRREKMKRGLNAKVGVRLREVFHFWMEEICEKKPLKGSTECERESENPPVFI